MFNRKLKTCATVSKLTRDQWSSKHDLSSLFAYSRNSRRRVSRCSRRARIGETGFRATRETVSALSGSRSCAAHDLPGVDHVVAGHYTDGLILRCLSSSHTSLTNM